MTDEIFRTEPVGVEDVDRTVAELPKAERYALKELFLARSRQTGDGRWRLLSEFAGMALHPERPDDPFTDGSALPILWQDVGDDLRDWLCGLAEGTTTPWLKARLCDVVWVRWRAPEFVELTVDAYVAAAQACGEGPASREAEPLLRRALRLAESKGKRDLRSRTFASALAAAQLAAAGDHAPLVHLLPALGICKGADQAALHAIAEEVTHRLMERVELEQDPFVAAGLRADMRFFKSLVAACARHAGIEVDRDRLCWICGAPADTGEHMTKRTDIEDHFGEVNQRDAPIYFNDARRRDLRVGSANADVFKSPARLCRKCNGAVTQPYDNAWMRLSRALGERSPPLEPGERVSLLDVFSPDPTEGMLGVQLYFVKLFGCHIRAQDIEIDTASFAEAIEGRVPHPDVYLRLLCVEGAPREKHIGTTEIIVHAYNADGSVAVASWIYFLGRVGVEVVYAEGDLSLFFARKAWHPEDGDELVAVAAEWVVE